MQMTPVLPTELPSEDGEIRINWHPEQGMQMDATLKTKRGAHKLNWEITVIRAYVTGRSIAGTARRTSLHLMAAGLPDGRWQGSLQAEHTAPVTLSGSVGGLMAALAAVSGQIIDYARNIRPLSLAGQDAIPVALNAPSGGQLCKLN